MLGSSAFALLVTLVIAQPLNFPISPLSSTMVAMISADGDDVDHTPAAPPSLFPTKKYCDITGLHATYTDPRTKLRYKGLDVWHVVRGLVSGWSRVHTLRWVVLTRGNTGTWRRSSLFGSTRKANFFKMRKGRVVVPPYCLFRLYHHIVPTYAHCSHCFND